MESDKFVINRVDLDEIITDINREVDNLSRYSDKEGKIIVLVAEKFYFRIESNLAATIIIERINENQYQIVVVVAGGKHGLLRVSYGAEKLMINRIKNLFLKK